MKKIIVETIWEEKYEAEDGKSFDNRAACELYEKYYKIPLKELLSPYLSFDNWEDPFDGTWRGAQQCFVFKEIPEEIVYFLRLAITSGRTGFDIAYEENSWRLKEGIIYFAYDISGEMSGRGSACWRFMGTKESLNAQIKFCERRIKEIENFEKTL